MNYQNFDLEAFGYRKDESGSEQFQVRVLRSPAGDQRQSGAELVVVPADLRQRVRLLRNRKLHLPEMIELGELLAKLLFPPPVRWFLDQSRARLGEQGLRIRLQLDAYALADLPWEYAYVLPPDTPPDQKSADGFVVLDRHISLVRYEAMSQPLGPLKPVGDGPVRLVVLLAQPKDPEYQQHPLDLDVEQRNIEQALAGVAAIKTQFYPDATLDLLHDAMDRGAHVFHFAGHGTFQGASAAATSNQGGKGSLVLLNDSQRAAPIPADKLALTLKGRGVRLAVLGGCETAERDQVNAWTGVAPALTRAGIPAVVGMQYRVADANAISFSKRFYKALAAGASIDAAVMAGRLAIFTSTGDDERDWGVPVLYLRAEEGVLFPDKDAGSQTATSSPQPASVTDNRQGTFISGGTVYGPVVGRNSGTITASYDMSPARSGATPSPQESGAPVDTVALRNAINQAFSVEELEILCSDVEAALTRDGIQLQVNLDNVGGSSKPGKVLNLIQFLERRGYLRYLVAAVRQTRTGII